MRGSAVDVLESSIDPSQGGSFDDEKCFPVEAFFCDE